MTANAEGNLLASSPVSGSAWRQEIKIKELEEQLLAMRDTTICALTQMLDLRDHHTGSHSNRLAEWAVRVAREMGMDDTHSRDVEAAAALHDIGKVGVDDSILRKKGKLTAEEYELMKEHPEIGWTILKAFPFMEQAALLVLHHHERYDGTGYPAGLEGDEIPIGARIVSLIDAFDAMVSPRPYRDGLGFNEAIRRVIRCSGTQFDPIVVRHFIHIASTDAAAVSRAVED